MANKTIRVESEKVVICPICEGKGIIWGRGYDSTVSALCHGCKGDRILTCVKTYYRVDKLK